MGKYKNYKDYLIKYEQWESDAKIKNIKKLLKMTQKEAKELDKWKKHGFANYLTEKQYKLLLDNKTTELKELLRKQLEKEKKKLEAKKEIAIEKYNAIKGLGDITQAQIEIIWSQRAGAYGYQCYCFGRVWYANGQHEAYETKKTSGWDYDKASSALSYFCNKLLKIIILKHDKKIINDPEKHYKYYACEPLYFQYGVGLSSYETMLKNLGYKTRFRYLQNDNILIDIEK